MNVEKILAEKIATIDWEKLRKEVLQAIFSSEGEEENYRVEDSEDFLLIPFAILLDASRGVYMINGALEMFGIDDEEVRKYKVDDGYIDVVYCVSIWEEVLDPIASELGIRLTKGLELPEHISLEFGFNDCGDYCGFVLYEQG